MLPSSTTVDISRLVMGVNIQRESVGLFCLAEETGGDSGWMSMCLLSVSASIRLSAMERVQSQSGVSELRHRTLYLCHLVTAPLLSSTSAGCQKEVMDGLWVVSDHRSLSSCCLAIFFEAAGFEVKSRSNASLKMMPAVVRAVKAFRVECQPKGKRLPSVVCFRRSCLTL